MKAKHWWKLHGRMVKRTTKAWKRKTKKQRLLLWELVEIQQLMLERLI